MNKYLLLVFSILLQVQWSYAQHLSYKKLYSTTGPTNQGTGIEEQSNGDLIVSGIRSVPVGAGQYIANIYLMRITNSGDTVWTKEIGTATDRELAYGMTQLPNGNLVITGSINLPPNGTSDALIIYADNSGNVIWQKRYGGNDNDQATDAVFDGKDIIVSGITNSYGAGDADAWLLKLNTSGDTIWTKTFGGAMVDDAWGVVAAHGAYYFTGGTYSFANGQYDDAWIVKTDTAGNEIWKKTYGVKDKVDWAWSISPVSNGGVINGFVFTGVKNTEENAPANSYGDLHFVKVDTAGSVVWDKSITAATGPNWRREGFDVKQLPDGGFVLCGYKLESTLQAQQLYVIKTNSTGDVLWDTAIGTADSAYYPNSLTITNDGGWAMTGFVFTPGQQIRYIYVAKFNPWNVNIEDAGIEADIAVYPNPANGVVHINAGNGVRVNQVVVYTIDGKLAGIYPNSVNGHSITVDIQQGVYLFEIQTSLGVLRKKVISDR